MILRLGTESTKGSVAVIEEVSSAAVSESSVHVHANEDEIFAFLEGRHGVLLADKAMEMGEGDILFAPRGVPHSHRFLSPGRVLILLIPAGLEALFARMSARLADGGMTVEQRDALAVEFGVTFL